MQSDMTNLSYTVLLIIKTKIMRQIRLSLIQSDRIIMASFDYPIYFLYASFIIKDFKGIKELFSIIESACGIKINPLKMKTFLELFYMLSTQSIPQSLTNSFY